MKNKKSLLIYDILDSDQKRDVTAEQVTNAFVERGISLDDPRLANAAKNLKKKGLKEKITKDEFLQIFSHEISFIEHVLKNELVIPDFLTFKDKIEQIFYKVKENTSGKVANYIPQLARMDPDKFAVSVCTIDGQVLHLGDIDDSFCVQSSCKPINYCLALEEHGLDKVHRHVGHEPSGRSFNELTLNSQGLPHNPLINSGAIMCCSLIKQALNTADRFDHVLQTWRKICNNNTVGFNNSVYLSERETADRNRALAYFMREHKAFPANTDIKKTLEFYFQCCSIETSCKNISNLAATLANGGVCPFTNSKVFKSSTIKNCLSLMYSCGMYDFSGEFSFMIGLPAKSGVSGVCYIVVPNTLGISIWSPRLDLHGNSVRAIEFCKELTKTFLFHNYDSLVSDEGGKINPRIVIEHERSNLIQEMCYAAANGDIKYLQSLLIRGGSVNDGDYDKRTPLHLAMCENKLEAADFLIRRGANIHAKDRWGRSPLEEGQKLNSKHMQKFIAHLMNGGKKTAGSLEKKNNC